MAASWPSCSVPCILPDCVCSLLSNVLLYVDEHGKMKIKKCSVAILICSLGLDHSVMLLHFLKAFI
jgi:hypothetical protein